jgi:hypothetical protein
MSDIVQTIQALSQLLPLKPAAAGEIADAEKQLGLRFADEYKEYISTFGAILADDIELTGIAKAKSRNVVSVTMQERKLNPDVPDDYYVIENVGVDGIIIWQNASGSVYRTAPNLAPVEIAPSLAAYLASKQ